MHLATEKWIYSQLFQFLCLVSCVFVLFDTFLIPHRKTNTTWLTSVVYYATPPNTYWYSSLWNIWISIKTWHSRWCSLPWSRTAMHHWFPSPGGSDSQTQPRHHIFAEGKSTKEDKCLQWKVLILFAFAPLRCLDWYTLDCRHAFQKHTSARHRIVLTFPH